MVYLKNNYKAMKSESQSVYEADFFQVMLPNKKVIKVAPAGFSQWLSAAGSVPSGACCSTTTS